MKAGVPLKVVSGGYMLPALCIHFYFARHEAFDRNQLSSSGIFAKFFGPEPALKERSREHQRRNLLRKLPLA